MSSSYIIFLFAIITCINAHKTSSGDCDFFDLTKGINWKIPSYCTYFHSRGYPVGGDVVLQRLASAVSSSNTVKTFDLGGCNLGDHGIKALSISLENSHVEYLHLGHNNLTCVSAPVLSSIIENNKYLRGIDLSYNKWEHFGATKLADSLTRTCHLEWIYLEASGIDDESMRVLVYGLIENHKLCYPRGLLKLRIGGNSLGISSGLFLAQYLILNPPLQMLDIGYNQIQSLGASAIFASLYNNTNLKILDLEHNYISLNRFMTLDQFSYALELCGINKNNTDQINTYERDIVYTTDNRQLHIESLVLRHNNIDINDLIAVMNTTTNLLTLDIGQCNYQPNELTIISNYLINSYDKLTYLYIDSNNCSDENAYEYINIIINQGCYIEKLKSIPRQLNTLSITYADHNEDNKIPTSNDITLQLWHTKGILPSLLYIESHNELLMEYQKNFTDNKILICKLLKKL
jgi:hypothetical protein